MLARFSRTEIEEKNPISIEEQIKDALQSGFIKENANKKIKVKNMNEVAEIEKQVGLVHQVGGHLYAVEIKTLKATGKSSYQGNYPFPRVERDKMLHELCLFQVTTTTNGSLAECKSNPKQAKVLKNMEQNVLGFGSRIIVMENEYTPEPTDVTIEFYQANLTTGFTLLGSNKILNVSSPHGLAIYPVPNTDLFLARIVTSWQQATLNLYHFNGHNFRELAKITDQMAINFTADAHDAFQGCDPRILPTGQIFVDLSEGDIGIFDLQTASYLIEPRGDLPCGRNLVLGETPADRDLKCFEFYQKAKAKVTHAITSWEKARSVPELETVILSADPIPRTKLPTSLVEIITSYACPESAFNKDLIPVRNEDQQKAILSNISALRISLKDVFKLSEVEKKEFFRALDYLKNEILTQSGKTFFQIVRGMEGAFATLDIKPVYTGGEGRLFGRSEITPPSRLPVNVALRDILKRMEELDEVAYGVREEKSLGLKK